jgi:N6-adenosine-specific RNA methylase IME4
LALELNKKYKVIYADPPWSYNDKMTGHALGADYQYSTQNIDWIKNLPVNQISDKDCALFLWAVSPQLPEAMEVITAWGFKYKTVAFVWNKKTPSWKDVSNLGRWTMGNIEVCLLATKGHPKRIRSDIKQLVTAERKGHSRKPAEIRSRIVSLMGDVPRIELFSRERIEGWDVFGNEVPDTMQKHICEVPA